MKRKCETNTHCPSKRVKTHEMQRDIFHIGYINNQSTFTYDEVVSLINSRECLINEIVSKRYECSYIS